MAVRLKDIARDLGVSVVTVSKVLRNHTDISEETRERVLKRMKELNYRPNLAARALVTGRSCTMGLVVPDLVHPFFSHVAKGVSKALRKKGYSLFISSSEEDAQLEQQEIEQMLARRVDALIIASAQFGADSLRRIQEQQVPFVLIDRQFPGFAANFIGVDDVAVGRMATSHLLDQGCRRIAHIRGPEVSPAVGRLQGYRQALAAHSISPSSNLIVLSRTGDDSGDVSGYEAMLKLLALQPRPDGVFCYNDPTALGAMKAILDSGLRVPDDIAVVGCGNVIYDTLLRVPLTSVDQDSLSIGEEAGNLALHLVESKAHQQPKTILLEPNLVVRASSQRRAI